jgi:superoxide dismutase, Fe-Mn family
MKRFEPQKFPRLKGLSGISDAVLESHLALYQAYVKNVNALNEQLEPLLKEGKAAGTNLAYAEMTRRLNFEYSGMVLHEYYFANLAPEPEPLGKDSALARAFSESYGSVDTWLSDFKAVAALRGVGWAIAFQDPNSRSIRNVWVNSHEDGNLPGWRPIVVLDAWEHAFVPDYEPTERAKYIEAYLRNLDYRACESRLLR